VDTPSVAEEERDIQEEDNDQPGGADHSHVDAASQANDTPASGRRYPDRVRNAPTTWYDTFVGASTVLSDDPTSLSKVKTRPDYEQWVQAKDDELASLLSKGTCSLVDLPFLLYLPSGYVKLSVMLTEI
jgi:hypothetical protein